MEGRSYSEFYRNTSEELFIKTMMESSIGMPAPTMEMLGFKNLAQNLRADSEELFKSWLTNGEASKKNSSSFIGHRPRQASRRISTELASLANQTGVALQKKTNDDFIFPQTTPTAVDSSNDLVSTRTVGENGLQGSNRFLAKAWFHSSHPMTRSRSSELRKKYVAMQNSQTPIGIEAMHEASENGVVNNFRHEPVNPNGFINNNTNISLYDSAFMSPSNSSSSAFTDPQIGSMDKISSVVSMLKGTLERKKLVNNQAMENTCFDNYYNNNNNNHGDQEIHAYENGGNFQDLSTLGVLQTIEESLLEGIIVGPTQMNTISREPSQSESSAQALSVCESSMNQMGGGGTEDYSRTKDYRERTYDNSIEDQKKGGLIRYGSVTSAGSVERGDPTKKRRVERSRKMAEAKGRSSTPTVPSDMQSVLKRCENLEKEVRSLKLNLSFMNRKDSEQTKQIEELQKQNQDLGDEKERLLEEIERIIAETGKM
ncbi:hypothetical protein MIMGU_mgv1a005418mg [Erythranthe guttata]|uniref:Protein CYCLOPS n=1 Tax=Erythranthe guttata TaxID=4155 RepID=A0A022QMC6_ERYGU|nr:hypothetical protein MIMGU_mgv1a005418mg [Erythranthe guttata]